jgi:hypothetical protein
MAFRLGAEATDHGKDVTTDAAGTYTAQVTGGTTGTAQVEVYALAFTP